VCPEVSEPVSVEAEKALGTITVPETLKRRIDHTLVVSDEKLKEFVKKAMKMYLSIRGPDCSIDEAANITVSEVSKTLNLERLEAYIDVAELLTGLLQRDDFQAKVDAEQLTSLIERWEAPVPLMRTVLHKLRRGKAK
jgi:hypothetical protein